MKRRTLIKTAPAILAPTITGCLDELPLIGDKRKTREWMHTTADLTDDTKNYLEKWDEDHTQVDRNETPSNLNMRAADQLIRHEDNIKPLYTDIQNWETTNPEITGEDIISILDQQRNLLGDIIKITGAIFTVNNPTYMNQDALDSHKYVIQNADEINDIARQIANII